MNKLTTIGALVLTCASNPAFAEPLESNSMTAWYVAGAISVLVLVCFCIHDFYFSSSLVASEKLIRRTVEKHPELRFKIQEHLKSKVLTRGDLADMESTLVIESHLASVKEEKEEERKKQLGFLDKDL